MRRSGGVVCGVSDPFDESIPEDHRYRRKIILQQVQLFGQSGFQPIGFVFRDIQSVHPLFDSRSLVAAESECEQFI